MGFNLPKMGSNQAIEFGVIIILYIYSHYIVYTMYICVPWFIVIIDMIKSLSAVAIIGVQEPGGPGVSLVMSQQHLAAFPTLLLG